MERSATSFLAVKKPKRHKGNRFTLLFLEFNEILIQDFAVNRYPAPTPDQSWVRCVEAQEAGRLKLCTRGLVFEPADKRIPIVRYPFKAMPNPIEPFELQAGSAAATGVDRISLFTITCKSWVDLEVGGHVAPFVPQEPDSPVQFVFQLLHSPLPDFLDIARKVQRLETSRTSFCGDKEALRELLQSRMKRAFELRELVDFREQLLLRIPPQVDRINPLLRNPGILMVTDRNLYFQPSELNNLGEGVDHFPLRKLSRVYKRRHMLRQTGIELITSDGRSALFNFESQPIRDEVFRIISTQSCVPKEAFEIDVASVTRQWQRREISNFEYLTFLNSVADRSIHDLTQYPVYPWVIQDYSSSKLDLENPATFRDLSKPIGALNPNRLEYFRERFHSMPEGNPDMGIPPPFLYGSHYSTPGFVLFYLVRAAPQHMLCLQSGKFDAADRMFHSMEDTWQSVLKNPSDVKELVPEFYDSDGSFLVNTTDLPLGKMQDGQPLGNVILPPWAKNARSFVRQNAKALESEYVSAHLHEWIDLIFGYKQKGQAAVDANNLFYYLTYEGAVDLESLKSESERAAIESQINEFGQCPKQLFVGAHPSRDRLHASVGVKESVDSTVPNRRQESKPFAPPTYAEAQTLPRAHAESTSTRSYNPTSTNNSSSTPLTRDSLLGRSKSPDNASSYPSSTGPTPPPPPSLDSAPAPSMDSGNDLLTRVSQLQFNEPSPSFKGRPTTLENKHSQPSPWLPRNDSVPTTPSSEEVSEKRDDSPFPSAAPSEPSEGLSDDDQISLEKAKKATLAASSAKIRLHREAITDLKMDSSQTAAITTSKDGSLRVTPFGTFGAEQPESLSRRLFQASDLALSCCAMTKHMSKPAVVCGSWDSTIFLYSVPSACVVGNRVHAHDDSVSTLDVNGSTICSGSWDAVMKVWNVTARGIEPLPVKELFEHQSPIQSLKIHPSGRYVVAGADDGRVVIWKLDPSSLGEVACVIEQAVGSGAVSAVAWGGRAGASFFVAGTNGSISEYSMSGSKKAGIDGLSQISSISIDQSLIAVGCTNGELQLWSWQQGSSPLLLVSDTGSHDEEISAVNLDVQSKRLVVASGLDIQLWTVASSDSGAFSVQ